MSLSPAETSVTGETSTCTVKQETTQISGGTKEGDTSPPRTPKKSPPPSDASPVSDDTCPICLGDITDKCVTNSCFHRFCLVCLKEWAKQKPVCPLCKLRFTTIMYEIKSESEYKEYVVPRPEPPERSQGIANFQEFLDAERRRFFGYRTTNFPGATALRRLYPGRPLPIPDSIPSGPRERRPTRYNHRGSSMFRLSVYHNNVWVQPIADITGRYRQSAPDLYREQPALTHRLVPWVNRELAALIPASRVGVVLTEVMDLIERYSIDSHEFRRAMRQHLGARTNHFVHEFYHFARSPYDMVGHDNAAQYVPRFGFPDETSSSSSDDSDAVVEIDIRGNPVSTTHHQGGTADPENIEREEILTQEGSVVISSDNSSSSETEEQPFLRSLGGQPAPLDLTTTHNPEPPTVGKSMRRLLGRARNFLSSVNEGASTSRSEEASEAAQGETGLSLKRELPSYSDDSDTCMIVEEVSKKDRVLDIIDLDTDEELAARKDGAGNHWKKKLSDNFSGDKNNKDGSSSSHQVVKKEVPKPSLKRHNFPFAPNSSDASPSKKSSKEDHSYCSEQKSSEVGSSASTSSHSGLVQTSSIEISLKWHNHSDKSGSVLSVRKKDRKSETHRNRIIISDSDSSSDVMQVKKLNHREKEKTKHKSSSSKTKSTDRTKEDRSSVQSSSAARTRKDIHSKVKSSSKLNTRYNHERHSHDRVHQDSGHIHIHSPETSSNSQVTSDVLWTPSSTTQTERSSSREAWYPDLAHSRDSSHDSRTSSHREHRGESTSTSKSRSLSKKRRHKHKHSSDPRKRSKKSKKSKHKKKSKTRKVEYSSDSSDSDSDSSFDPMRKKTKRKKKIIESSTSDTDTSHEPKDKRKPKKARKISDSSSS